MLLARSANFTGVLPPSVPDCRQTERCSLSAAASATHSITGQICRTFPLTIVASANGKSDSLRASLGPFEGRQLKRECRWRTRVDDGRAVARALCPAKLAALFHLRRGLRSCRTQRTVSHQSPLPARSRCENERRQNVSSESFER